MKRFLVKAFIIIYARGSQPTGRNQIAKLKLVHWYIFLESIELNKTTFLFFTPWQAQCMNIHSFSQTVRVSDAGIMV